MAVEHVDVLIVGAGISGIGAAVHLQKMCPGKTFAIMERRENFGGTWDLFRYPGIRSDSDMYTLGFRFKPWTARKAIADAPSIMTYLGETIEEYGLKKHIRFNHHVKRAHWSSEDATWTVEGTIGGDGKPVTITCNMLLMCSGYYNYDQGYTPDFEGRDAFKGHIVHPQHWPENLDYKGKKVIVIGSGATAVTLVPAMADTGAGHVTMLQRTPTYMVSRPAEDAFALGLRKFMPAKAAYWITRWRNVLMQQFMFKLLRKNPEKSAERLIGMVKDMLPEGFDVNKHFTPPYKPWDQRLCLVPDSDFFNALKDGRASIVTDHIDRFTEKGILLKSGEELEADIVVTATGLNMQMLSGLEAYVDGVPFHPGEHILHKGTMYNDVPNLIMWFGYTNASWTLKADLTSEYACRIINHLDKTGKKIAVPRTKGKKIELDSFVDFSSGYFTRAASQLPKQGKEFPWKLHQNYGKDIQLLRYGSLDDEAMCFEAPHKVEGAKEAPALLEAAE
ncbi:NAD(P)/FAD-dependent oxidoreductase [Chakrabartia godavariana]|nr:NAD(P)/FAD-dependent oxidoreductase [Chakrabartia godavariana]